MTDGTAAQPAPTPPPAGSPSPAATTAPSPPAPAATTAPAPASANRGAGSERYKERGVVLRVLIYVVAGHLFAGFLWLLFYLGAHSH
ncbi:DUF6126 family protein [Actinacidiphila sp. ITFR-21]|uniref:DUF6126 family protein n=1 Tax=Actinacidiphila sp. ITFR-21 TaxID=3075199 RepID=UPI00288A84DF|nr:DUF6126 family protein [Streptomyces sp. ITFR-21]WNI16797.1 DUF6126 family protein [Streptomyces sp. ITFR-21]